MCFSMITTFSFVNYAYICTSLLTGSFGSVLVYSVLHYLCILFICLLLDVELVKIFTHSVGFHFVSKMGSFAIQKIQIFTSFHLSNIDVRPFINGVFLYHVFFTLSCSNDFKAIPYSFAQVQCIWFYIKFSDSLVLQFYAG